MDLIWAKGAKKTIITILAVSLLLHGCSGDAGENWKEITGHDMTYSARLPKKPTYNKQKIPVPRGVIDFSIYELITKEVNYTFGCSDYPRGFLETMGKNGKEIFDSSLKSTIQQLKAKVLESKDGFTNGFPSRTTIMKAYMPENSSNMIIRQDSYLVKGRMYIAQTLVFEDRVEKNKEIVEYFHNSFTFEPDLIK